MDSDDISLYMQNLEEFVLDDKKVVTFKWLSQTLGIHVNLSRKLLNEFVVSNEEAKKSGGLYITYIIGGLLNNCDNYKFSIVCEDDLPEEKKRYQTVITEHIYSVQRNTVPRNRHELFTVDKTDKVDIETIRKIGGKVIKEPRSAEEIAELRKLSLASLTNVEEIPNKKPVNKTVAEVPAVNEKQHEENNETNEDQVEKKAKIATKNQKTKGSGIAAMFAAQSNKPQRVAANNSTLEKPKAKSGISCFFNQKTTNLKATQNDKDSKSLSQNSELKEKHSPKKEKKDSNNSSNQKSPEKKDSNNSSNQKRHDKKNSNNSSNQKSPEKKDSNNSSNQKRHDKKNSNNSSNQKSPEKKDSNNSVKIDEAHSDNSVPNSKDKSNSTAKKNKSKKSVESQGRNRKAKNVGKQESKKRKRIVAMSDSDSSDEEEIDLELEDAKLCNTSEVAPPSPQISDSEDIIPSTPQPENNKKRGRKRKLVDKTFVDDDGYVITKKEYVFESCSDDEIEDSSNKPQKKEKLENNEKKDEIKESPSSKRKSPRKNAALQGVKQSSIMTFFKKK